MSKTYVHWSVRRIDPRDIHYNIIQEKETSFSSFIAAAKFAKEIPHLKNNEELVGKPVVMEL